MNGVQWVFLVAAASALIFILGCSDSDPPRPAAPPTPIVDRFTSFEMQIQGAAPEDNIFVAKANSPIQVFARYSSPDPVLDRSSGVLKVSSWKKGRWVVEDGAAFRPAEDSKTGEQTISVEFNAKRMLKPGIYAVEIHFAGESNTSNPSASTWLRLE